MGEDKITETENRIVVLGVKLQVEQEELVMDITEHIRDPSGDGNDVIVIF